MGNKKITKIQEDMLKRMQTDFDTFAVPIIKKKMKRFNITKIEEVMGSILIYIDSESYCDDDFCTSKAKKAFYNDFIAPWRNEKAFYYSIYIKIQL